MAESKKYNNFSKKLLAFLPKLERGQTLRFQLEGVYVDKVTKKLVCPKSKNLPKVDRIWDPWGGQTGKGAAAQYEGDYVDIGLIIREVPAPQDSARDTVVEFGKVEFFQTFAGIIEVHGGNLAEERMLPMLFFCNRNKSNVGKPWFIKPPGKAIYSQLQKEQKAKEDLSKELRIDQAKALISKFTEEEVKTAAAGLMPHQYRSMTNEQRILSLRALAVSNPDKILDLSGDVAVQTTALIEAFLQAHLIKIDQTKGQVLWVDDNSTICLIKPGQTPHNSLKHYFMTDIGNEVLKTLEKQLELSKASIKDKTEKVIV